MNEQQRGALLRIARCDIFSAGPNNASPCKAILALQNGPPQERQVPEPWRGRLDSPLLFVSSNPSIDAEDDSPRARVSDDVLLDYFSRGFPRTFPKIAVGNGRLKTVRFWAAIYRRAAELWCCDVEDVRPGIDFAITEVVHCKSRGEAGVRAVLSTCKDMHWSQVIRASKARVIVVIGLTARNALGLEFPLRRIRRLAESAGVTS